MPQVFGYINGNELIGSGCIVADSSQSIELTPFLDEPAYKIGLKIVIDDDFAITGPSLVTIKEGGLTIQITRGWIDGNMSAHIDTPVAETESHEFLMSLSISFIGAPDRYAVSASYSITRRTR